MKRYLSILLECVATLAAMSGCAHREEKTPPDPPSLEERSSPKSMMTIRLLQIREALTLL